MKLIDKDALVSEIERLVNNHDKALDYEAALEDVRNSIDTLEVKEVEEAPVSEELEKELSAYVNSKEYTNSIGTSGLLLIARHFANWQKEQFEKGRLKHCDELTSEQAQIESDFVTQHLKKNNRTPTFIDAIEYGMKIQKAQMMSKAVDGEVTYGKGLIIPSLGYRLDKEGFDFGDKVKVLVVKGE